MEQEPEPIEKARLSDADVVEHMPKTMLARATALLNRLKARLDVISWDESGQVSLDGKEIPHSNISDLVSDALRNDFHFLGDTQSRKIAVRCIHFEGHHLRHVLRCQEGQCPR